jgi:hypothetical protein
MSAATKSLDPTRSLQALTLAAALAALAAAGPLGAALSLECGETVDGSRCALRIGDALALEASRSNITELPRGAGLAMTGAVTLKTPLVSFDLVEARLTFRESGLAPGFEVYGTAGVPVGTFPFLGGSLSVNPRATIGIVGRDSLRYLLETDEPLPLAENPGAEPIYIFFHFDSGLELDLQLAERLGLETREGAHDPFQYALPGRNITLIVDPTDPYYYISANARKLALAGRRNLEAAVEAGRRAWEERRRREEAENEGAGKKSKKKRKQKPRRKAPGELGAFAYSHQNGIPFSPRTTWGLPPDILETASFKGGVFVDTTVPLGYGVQLSGPVVTLSDPLDLTYKIGGNADVSLGFTFPGGILGLELPLGEATAGASLTPDRALIYASGVLAPNTSFLPPWFPITLPAEVKAATYIDSDRLEQTRFLFSGRFNLGLKDFTRMSGAPLATLLQVEGDLIVDSRGVFIRGMSASRVHRDLVFDRGYTVEAFLSAAAIEESYLRLEGHLFVGRVDLGASAEVDISRHGVSIDGSFVTPLSEIAMHGGLGRAGPILEGRVAVNFATGGISDAILAARAAVANAIAEVERLDREIARQRAIVHAEREDTLEPLRDAEAAVVAASARVDSIESQIAAKDRRIAQLRRELGDWHDWYRGLPGWKKVLEGPRYTAAVARLSAEIAVLAADVTALRVSLSAAQAALAVAERALEELARAIQVIPVDLDPRVAVLLAAREAALLVLRAAQAALDELPTVDGDFLGEVTLTLSRRGIHGDVRATFRGTELVRGFVTFGASPSACVSAGKLGNLCAPF